METAKINTDNEWTTVVDKKKVKRKKRMKKKLLQEQKNYYNNSRKLYKKNTKTEIKQFEPKTKIQETPETTYKETRNEVVIITNAFDSLLNEFDESSK
ncbi:uncharacterized protein METZ01_LOCUS148515 [marine metagenome]|uniref:Uncharacterized protein n=1 Tax=marine metagenome TaxID=408172 RepID=A0A382A357_9ZZZZ